MSDLETPEGRIEPKKREDMAFHCCTIYVQVLVLAAVWYLIYISLAPFANWFTYRLLGLTPVSHLGGAVAFFVLDAPKVLMLLVLITYIVGAIRTFFSPEQTKRLLVGRREFVGNILAALVGVPTPFCSCSAVPLFLGFLEAGIPLGVTMSFLISSPIVNEIALVLLYGMFGIKVALLYLITGLVIAVLSGWVIGKLHPENYLEEWVKEIRMVGSAGDDSPVRLTWPERLEAGKTAVREIVGGVWPYLIGGIALGAGIYGYVPTSFMASFMGRGAWWNVPVAVLIGIPLYSSAAGVIPVVEALMQKGASLGTTLAFMMSVIGISIPELVILRKVLKMPMIWLFTGIMALGIILVGYLFNIIL